MVLLCSLDKKVAGEMGSSYHLARHQSLAAPNADLPTVDLVANLCRTVHDRIAAVSRRPQLTTIKAPFCPSNDIVGEGHKSFTLVAA